MFYKIYKEIYFGSLGYTRGAKWWQAGAEYYCTLIITFIITSVTSLLFAISNNETLMDLYFNNLLFPIMIVIMVVEHFVTKYFGIRERLFNTFNSLNSNKKRKYKFKGLAYLLLSIILVFGTILFVSYLYV